MSIYVNFGQEFAKNRTGTKLTCQKENRHQIDPKLTGIKFLADFNYYYIIYYFYTSFFWIVFHVFVFF